MNALSSINKLLEIQCDLTAFESELNVENVTALKVEFNNILIKLRKPIKYNYETPQDLIDTMIELFNLKEDFAASKLRQREDYITPRHIAITISKHIFIKRSLAYIGSFFTNGDYSTVLHAIKTVHNLYDTDTTYRKMFDDYQKQLLGCVCINFDKLRTYRK